MDLSKLTDRQREIYNFIKTSIETQGYGPTVRDIGDHFGIRSPNGVMCHLKALETKGIINRKESRARAIQLVEHHPPVAPGLPFLGQVAAGSPTQAVESDDRLEYDELFGGPEQYVLRVNGNSMIDSHIEDGDYVVIKKQETARNGERVVAMIDDEVTLKRFYKEANRIRLEPANGKMKPIIVDDTRDARILGILAGVIRKY